MNDRTIYAVYDDETIRVYQAYGDKIAKQALEHGTFGSEFKLDRMTWIKPSFLWMMYRSSWATKEGQTRILAIDIKREGFNLIAQNSIFTSFKKDIYGTHENWKILLEKSDARCQWDPDRDIYGNPQDRRTIQLGISGIMVRRYISEWITKITDITPNVVFLRKAIEKGEFDETMLPVEKEYNLTGTVHSSNGSL